ncbi:bifunctional metallophosphatase/5'-nucleotidase [Falsibacillus albus]|uniref:Bifunctional metallophosphatase/5'-nucleotidase n=1 Tax=Falsibacillus albus TaxID=2478915 RepID=A0A3L7K1Q6_9BACI|nr:bifunctional UDP-sugar hydrolase/5'-nucleotidase [Falsibacillus albus]RLQ96545.1 bifunctional metallophosphatase/5'-nucleotidase [Falsibacillus albus]
MKEKIHIYHTNDIHSHLENWSGIKEFLSKKRCKHEYENEAFLLFDIGDFADRWHPLTEATMGKGNIDLLNEAKYTAATIGNNEGITLPFDELDQLYEEAAFDVILANLFYRNGTRPDWAVPHKVYETAAGTKIGVTGVTAYFHKIYEILGWDLQEPFEVLRDQIKELKKHSDIIIVLSHLGIHHDEKMAEEFKEIDIILGAHTHHVLQDGKMVNQSLLGAAGKYGQYIGYVNIEVNLRSKEISNKKARLFEEKEWNQLQDQNPFWERGKHLLQEPVTVLDSVIGADWFQFSPLPQLLCNALHEWCKADCAFLNAGLVLKGLEEGIVTKYNLLETLPHPINPCIITLTGSDLKEVIQQSFSTELAETTVKGLGFRGKQMGIFHYSGITFDESREITHINGQIFNEGETYHLATVDMFTFGRFFPKIYDAAEKQYLLPEFLRDILEYELKKQKR